MLQMEHHYRSGTIDNQLKKLGYTSNIIAFTDGSTLGSPGPTGAGALNELTTIF